MTLRDKFLKNLINCGLSAEQATEVLERYLNDDRGKSMKEGIDDDESGYPPSLLASAWLNIEKIAIQWIDEKVPDHFARLNFIV